MVETTDAPSKWIPSEQDIREAYIYLLSRYLVIRQERTDAAAVGFAYNTIRYNPLGSADFVNPNFDVAYLEAWFAIDDDSAVLLEIPEVTGRYYTAEVLDEWGEVIFNVNERVAPSKPCGTFALVTPGTKVAVPPGATPVHLHSRKAKMLARVELAGDPDGAVALQHAFTATTIGSPVIAPPPTIPDFDNTDLLDSRIFDELEAALGGALDVSPAAFRMQTSAASIASYLAAPGARSRIDALLRDHVVPEFRRFALTEGAPYVNNWMGGAPSGNYGANYTTRTIVNLLGIWANTNEEVVYFMASSDAAGAPLSGAHRYVMHFPADDLPDSVVTAYWSIILVSIPDFRVIPNSLDRYNFNNHSPLTLEADGSLKICAGPTAATGVPETNWLPTDPASPFSLTFRCYVPKDFVAGGGWAPPLLNRVD